MMVKGARKAYLVSRPGLEGYVSVLYQTDPLLWREKTIWDLQGSDIASIHVDYLATDVQGYHLQLQSDGQWRLQDPDQPASAKRIEDYLRLFTGQVNGESFAAKDHPGMRDSLETRKPDVRFEFTNRDQKTEALRLFARPDNANNYFGYLEGKPELYTVQHFVIDKFLKTQGFFLPSS